MMITNIDEVDVAFSELHCPRACALGAHPVFLGAEPSALLKCLAPPKGALLPYVLAVVILA